MAAGVRPTSSPAEEKVPHRATVRNIFSVRMDGMPVLPGIRERERNSFSKNKYYSVFLYSNDDHNRFTTRRKPPQQQETRPCQRSTLQGETQLASRFAISPCPFRERPRS